MAKAERTKREMMVHITVKRRILYIVSDMDTAAGEGFHGGIEPLYPLSFACVFWRTPPSDRPP